MKLPASTSCCSAVALAVQHRRAQSKVVQQYPVPSCPCTLLLPAHFVLLLRTPWLWEVMLLQQSRLIVRLRLSLRHNVLQWMLLESCVRYRVSAPRCWHLHGRCACARKHALFTSLKRHAEQAAVNVLLAWCVHQFDDLSGCTHPQVSNPVWTLAPQFALMLSAAWQRVLLGRASRSMAVRAPDTTLALLPAGRPMLSLVPVITCMSKAMRSTAEL